jgi:multiple antibiotic resistance protein
MRYSADLRACRSRPSIAFFAPAREGSRTMNPEFFISALVTLLVVVDPLGLVPIFTSLTARLPIPARRRVAIRASLIAFLILCGAALIGDWLLRQLGIGLPAFRIAGGLLLFSIASEMVFGVRIVREANSAEAAVEDEHVRNIAAFPLGIPLMAGPGAITAVILLAGRAAGDPVRLGGLIAVIAVVMLACLAAFLIGARLTKLLGVTGNVVLERLLGVILAALAVQFVIDGVRAVWA